MSNISHNEPELTGDPGTGVEGFSEIESEVIPRRLVGRDAAPLSLAQERLWVFDQITSKNAAHNLSLSISITGALNIAALERSLNEIVRRHEVLRTTFSIVEGQPRQIIEPPLSVAVPIIDLTDRREDEREHESGRIAGEQARQPFDLAYGPLLKATLLRLASEDHVLLLTAHRMICDDGSMQVFFRELTVLYEAFANGQPSPLPDLPVQYADFSVWQKDWLRGQVIETQLSYWKGQLENVSALELPADRSRPADRSFRGEREFFSLPHELAQEIRAFSTEHDLTVFMTLLAGFQLLLQRYSGQNDIIVGSPIARRRRRDIENAIGLFANTWVLRIDLSGNPTFTELLSRVREMVLEAYANQDLPFEKLVEELRLEDDPSGASLVQVMFAFQKPDFSEVEIAGLKMHPANVHNGAAEFDLHLSMIYDDAWNISGFLEYGADLFDRETISRMLGHFQTLLNGIVVNPDQRIAEIPLLTETERQQLLVKWNDNGRDYPKDKCIHALFEDQVEKTPDAPAVVFNHQQLSYRELNARANQLAHYLQRSGVGPETLVGICMERSIELVVALLGVLKAGGAFVPMDSAYPKERLAFILEDTEVSALLTESRLLSQFLEYSGNQVCLDPDWEDFSEESEENPQCEVTPENVAYVIYTSGSTGKPKGVMIGHRSAGAFLAWAGSLFDAEELSGVLAATSICFDLSIFELFAPLTSGGKVILAESVLSLATSNSLAGVTLINTVPSIMAELVRLRTIPPTVRTINLAGEPLKTNLVREIYQTSPAKRVYDLYGPSEATTYSTWTLRAADGPQTIGRPISNTQIYLLDNHLQPVLIGVPGEIYIGGDGLARGYLNRPELTAEKFVANPFGNARGSRLYRTGDRARYRPDGTIEFLGRIDEQVKIRGYRIELGEIEAALTAHPRVREAVVMAREEIPENKQIVAYVVLNGDLTSPTRELRDFLRQQLPQYMVPTAFVCLDSMPVTSNGKVDRRALPVADQNKLDAEESFIAPRNPLEELLASIWCKVFKLDRVGMRDNFFELGGQSLLAVRIVTEIESMLKKRLPLAVLLQFPTIEEIVGILAEESSAARPSLVAVQPLGSKPPLFFVYGDYAYSRLIARLDPGQPFYGFPMPLMKATRRIRIKQSAADYLEQIRKVQPEGPYFVGGHSIGGLIAFEIVQQLQKQRQQVALIALFDPMVPGPRRPVESQSAPDKIRQHALNVAGMSAKKKLKYAASWMAGQIEERIYRRYKRLLCDVYDLINKPMLPELEKFYIESLFGNVFHEAAANYSAEVYPGQVVYFKSETERPESLASWQKLARDGLEVHEVPGDHQSMLLEPHVKNLGKVLTQCLSKGHRGEYLRSLILSVSCFLLELARWQFMAAV